MEFRDRTVLITGAAGNLGRAVAAAFAAAGATLALFGHDERSLAAAYPGKDPKRLLLACDLRVPESVETAVRAAAVRFGRIDVLAHIAGGFAKGHPVHATPPDVWREMTELNAGSLLGVASAVVPHMIRAGSGKIITIGAMSALAGRADMGAYTASKSALMRLSEAMSGELREQGINVNCILPGIIDTPQNRAAMPKADPGRWVEPAAIAEVVLFLASERARAIHGASIPVTGLA